MVSDRAAAKAVVKERRRMRRLGFQGRAGKVMSHTKDKASHHMRVVQYHFPGNHKELFVEVYETHHGPRPARIIPFSEYVHLAQNISDSEFCTITGRRRPHR